MTNPLHTFLKEMHRKYRRGKTVAVDGHTVDALIDDNEKLIEVCERQAEALEKLEGLSSWGIRLERYKRVAKMNELIDQCQQDIKRIVTKEEDG